MRTDVAIDKLCEIAPALGDIAEGMKTDEEFKNFILKYRKDKTDNISFLFRILPLLLKKFKSQIFEILSVIGEKNVEDIKAQPIGVTINQLKELFKDEDFRSFFSLSTVQAETQVE